MGCPALLSIGVKKNENKALISLLQQKNLLLAENGIFLGAHTPPLQRNCIHAVKEIKIKGNSVCVWR